MFVTSKNHAILVNMVFWDPEQRAYEFRIWTFKKSCELKFKFKDQDLETYCGHHCL